MTDARHARMLHEVFQAQAQRTPGHIALRHDEDSITYADLAARAQAVTAGLQAAGVAGGQAVGLHVERSADWVAAMLGILAAGAAVVPLPPAYPEARLRDILTFARLDAVVDEPAFPLPGALGQPALSLADLLATRGRPVTASAVDPEQPAFVLCSSGSTGVPKLIVRSHRSFFHRLEWTWQQHPFAPGEVGCQKAYMTTTHSLYELFEPLLAGAPTEIIPEDLVRDLERFWERLGARGVTRLLIVPSALRASLDMPGFVPPAGLNVVVLMGEYVPPGLAGRAVAAFAPHTRLYSIYGSTEASSTLVCDLRAAYRPGAELPLGKPIAPEVAAHVLGPDLQPVSAGETGRLYMAGPALFSGYFRDPERTAEVVVSDAPSGQTLYDSHDQVRRLPDGDLEFVGRVDHTVKIRGFRVDVLEVERALLAHPEVRQAAVLVAERGSAGASLVGCYLPASVDRASVFAALRDQLAPYMVPSELVGLDAFPLTASAKVDRRRLLASLEGAAPADAAAADLTEAEQRVHAAWAAVLGHARFGRQNSFFEAGGTSLTAFALVQRLRAEFGLGRDQLGEPLVYRHPTLREMAGEIARLAEGGPAAPAAAAGTTPILVTLRGAGDRALPPLFMVASAGGTLGAYDRLTRALATPREIVGIRDPLVWGEREPTESFQQWVGRYLEAIRERQPAGPYHLCAYSSAGAFGYELARRLRQAGQEVALLALIDPLALHRHGKTSYGYWALRATGMRPSYRTLVRLAGWLRVPAVRLHRALGAREIPNDHAMTPAQYEQMAARVRRGRHHVRTLAALLELNGGLPYALDDAALDCAEDGDYLGVLLARVGELSPEIDLQSVERLATQYSLQVGAQQAYGLNPLDCPVVLVEAESGYAGILAALLQPYAAHLERHVVPLGPPAEGTGGLTAVFGTLDSHYRCMRDEVFAAGVARILDPILASSAPA